MPVRGNQKHLIDSNYGNTQNSKHQPFCVQKNLIHLSLFFLLPQLLQKSTKTPSYSLEADSLLSGLFYFAFLHGAKARFHGLKGCLLLYYSPGLWMSSVHTRAKRFPQGNSNSKKRKLASWPLLAILLRCGDTFERASREKISCGIFFFFFLGGWKGEDMEEV